MSERIGKNAGELSDNKKNFQAAMLNLLEDLKNSEGKYRNLIENTNDIIFSVNLKGIITYVSPQTKKYGMPSEGLVGRNFSEIMHPQDIKKIAKDLHMTFKTGKEFPSTFRRIGKDGKIYWFEEFGKLLKDKSGKIIGLQGVLRDVTEKKNAENELMITYNTSLELNKSTSMDEVYGILIKELNIAAPNAYLFISAYDEDSGLSKIARLSGLENYINKATKLIGLNPLKMGVKTSEMNKEELKIFTSQRLTEIKKGFYTISVRKIPKIISKALEKLMGIKKIYTMGFNTFENNLRGGVTLLLKDAKPLNKKLIENLINQASITIAKHINIIEIKKKEEQYSLLFDSVSDGVIFIDNEGIIKSANPKFLEIIGNKENEIINKNINKVIPLFNSALNNPPQGFAKSIYGNMPESKEITIINCKGAKIIAQIKASPVKKNNKIIGLSLIISDITKKKETEEKIISLKNDYESIFESSKDIIIVFDQNGIISKINNAFEKILKKKKQNLINNNISKLNLTDLKEEKVPFEKIDKNMINKTFETKINSLIFSATISIVQSYSNKVLFQLSLRDITNEKEMEKVKEFNERILLKKMEEENMIKLKNQLLMRVSHELRHPLVPIVGYTSVMLEENPSEIQEKYLQKILQNSNYLKDLINKVLELINFETGEARINPAKFNINKLIERIIFENETKAELKGFKIAKELKKVGNVVLDEQKLKTAIGNILDNAIKFTDAGKVTITLDKNESQVIIGINDTGKGMTREEIERIFTYSQNEKYDNLNMGLGLGLILSKYIINAHNGELIISSVPAKGTSIKIIVPKVIN